MRINEDSGAVLAAVLLMVAFNGLFLSANGIFMLVAPLTGEARQICEAVHGSFPRVPVYLVP